jgi:hypothetical protein
MSGCYTFDEWFKICREFFEVYWSCLDSCARERGGAMECINKCMEEVVKHGMEKYGLNERQARLCVYMMGPAY